MSDEIVTLEDDDQVLDVELENYNVPVQEAVIHEGTTAYWNAQSSLIAESGHIYAYTDYTTVEGNDSPGIKVGDGVTLLSELPFVSGDTTVLDAHIANTVIHVTAAEKESWDSKVDPEEGKGLSENDFTDALKAKLEGIEAGAEVNVQSDWTETDTTADSFIQHKPEIPDHTSDLINDSGFITANEAPVQGVKGSAESAYRTGNVSVSKTDIGLGNVDNTSDLNKPISTAVQTALDGKQGTLTAGENITIDANNVISASGGGTGAVESVNGKTGVVVLDADDVGALPDTTTASDLGAYVKPSSGIPKTDLASAVQTSLDKADTALQTAPVTSVNTRTGAVVLTASDVGAYTLPSGGIPKSDLATAVQTSLDKADTALQSAPVTSVNSKTGAVTIDATDIETSSGVAIKSVSGNPVTIADALQGKALGVNATLEPIQSGSGDPSPTNIRPISGRTQVDVTRTGKNLCPPVTIGQSYNNSIGVEMSDSTSASSVKFPIDKDKTYIFTKNCNVNFMIFAWDAQGNFVGRTGGSNVSSRVLTKSSFSGGSGTGDFDSIAQIAVRFYQSTDQDINDVVGAEYQVEVGDTATAYEQYVTPQSVIINLGQTVYGGTLNVSTGELTVETANIASYNGESIGEPWWSSMDEYVAGTTPTTGAQVVYTLASPTTVSLTPAQIQLLTTTNIISTNADDLSVRYYATGQTGNVEGNIAFLLDKTASNETAVNTVSESIAPAETGTATQNYAVGSYLMLNNRLCKVTSAIATGEQIIVGSNVQYTTVAEELTAIIAQLGA